MGLDISNADVEGYEADISYYIGLNLDSNHRNIFYDYLEKQQYDKILSEVKTEHIDVAYATSTTKEVPEEQLEEALNKCLEEFKESVQREINNIEALNSSEASNDDLEMARKYSWIYDDESVDDSRMGSYSTIHYGRMFADLVDKHYQSKDLDIRNGEQILTREDIESILVKIETEGTTNYNPGYFDNLCNHSDCDGVYIPVQERPDFENGSSIGLLKELDLLYEIKAVEILKTIMTSIETEYDGEANVKYAPEEVRTLYRLAGNCEWVIRKMLYHAVLSVEGDSIICFC